MKRWFSRSLVVAAVAAVTTTGLVPAAYATTITRLEAEDGTIVDTGCGDDGPAAEQSGGTGTVVFLPGDACQITFDGDSNWRRPKSVRFFITGQAATMCGRFVMTGGFSGTSSTQCVDGTNPLAGYVTATFSSTSGTGGSDFTIEWDVTTGASYVNAYVDYVELSAIEAEEGTVVNPLCGDDGPMGTVGTGNDAEVFFPGNNCALVFATSAGTPNGAVFKVTGASGTICGHFEFTGAWVGSTGSVCGGTPARASASLSAGTGLTYTVTWKTDTGTPTYVNAYLNYLTHA